MAAAVSASAMQPTPEEAFLPVIFARQIPCTGHENGCISDEWHQREWSLSQLKLFDSIKNPIYIADVALEENKGLHYTDPRYIHRSHVVFANTAMVASFGAIRAKEENDALYVASNDEFKRLRWEMLHNFTKAGCEMQVFTRPSYLLHKKFLHMPPADAPQAFDVRVLKVKLHKDQPAVLCMFGMADCIDPDLARVAAMQHLSPIHTFQFDEHGDLIMANRSAMDKYPTGSNIRNTTLFELLREGHVGADGKNITLFELFKEGIFIGGWDELQGVYDDAMAAIFKKKEEVFRYVQTRMSSKGSGSRFILFEVWPLTDPVTGELSMLVSLHNVSEQKKMELELQKHKDALERANQDLEMENLSLENHNQMIEQEKAELAAHLEAVMAKTQGPKKTIDAETPLDKVLKLLDGLVLGQKPVVEDILAVRALLTSSSDLRAPVELEQQLMAAESMEEDVSRAIMQMLNIKGTQEPRPSGALTAAARTSHDLDGPSGDFSWNHRANRSTRSSLEMARVVPSALSLHVERRLRAAGQSWQYDVWALEQEAPGHPLALVAFHLLTSTGLVAQFNLNEAKLARFLNKIEAGYMDNPYHNRMHAAEVFQRMHMLMQHGGLLRRGICDGLSTLAGYIAAAVHDYEHRGLTNDYLVRARDPLAVTYNEQSPMENHHLAATFRLLQRSEYNFMEQLTRDEQAALRSTVISQVLATDMKSHFNTVSRFQTVFKAKLAAGSRRGTGDLASSSSRTGESGAVAGIDWEALSEEDKLLARKMALKCADLGHLAATPEIHRRWSLMLEEELFKQGDLERAHSMVISPLMDRSSPKGGVTRAQVGFFSIVGIPLFQSFVDAFEDAQPLLDALMVNMRMWEDEATQQKVHEPSAAAQQ
ncbi:hypothetical protein WJX72_011468 [[Myrmecia] bisecta]|uniref:Phosphodiesterase n=1 Tax=[Myrmecia] bisecta TaxID=41462 RepID=A0AAW1R9A9_9CHLO